MATTTSFSTQNIRQRNIRDHVNLKVVSFIVLIALPAIDNSVKAQESIPVLHFNVSIPQSTTDAYHVEFYINGLDQDTLNLKMPKWMPGYYQIMNYTENIYNISSQDPEGHSIPIKRINDNTWKIIYTGDKTFTLSYDIKAERQIVAK